MNPLLTKIAVGTLALSTIGTGAYFGGKELFRAPTIEEQLNKVDFRFIKDGDTAQGDLEFESDSTNIRKVGGDSVNDGTALMRKCKSTKALDSEKEKENVMKGCGIRSISNQLARNNKKYLVTLNKSDTQLDEKGKATYNKKKSDQSTRNELGLSGAGPTDDKDEMAEFKRLCGEKGSVDYTSDSKTTYTVAENGCTVEAATSAVPKV